MFIINIVNWIIDVIHLNIETRLTLIDNPELDLITKYNNALRVTSHWTLIQTVLASYLVSVRNMIPQASAVTSVGTWRRASAIANIHILVLVHVKFNVGDAIIIWRVHVFWSGRRERLVMLIPCAILLGNFGKYSCAQRLQSSYECGLHAHTQPHSPWQLRR